MGLKTSSYYIRTKAVTTGRKLTASNINSLALSVKPQNSTYSKSYAPSTYSVNTVYTNALTSHNLQHNANDEDGDIDCLSCTA